MNGSIVGALLGMSAMTGLLMIIGRWRTTAAPDLAERVALHRGTRSPRSREIGPVGTYLALLVPRLLRTSDRGSTRLSQAGRSGGLPRMRVDQLTWGGLGLVTGAVVAVWAILGGATVLALVLLPVLGAVVGLLLLDRHISSQVKRRRARIEEQLPDVAELLAFAVAAGESIVPALHRVSDMASGDLADELRVVVAEASTGIPVQDALRSASDRMGVPAVERFVDGLLISLERGTPLVGVVRAQAADARAAQQQNLMEQAGKKDVVMLIPVVFLILPTIVVIALFPGLRGLQVLTS
jgi:tight adherence protein C